MSNMKIDSSINLVVICSVSFLIGRTPQNARASLASKKHTVDFTYNIDGHFKPIPFFNSNRSDIVLILQFSEA